MATVTNNIVIDENFRVYLYVHLHWAELCLSVSNGYTLHVGAGPLHNRNSLATRARRVAYLSYYLYRVRAPAATRAPASLVSPSLLVLPAVNRSIFSPCFVELRYP